jgi:peptide/nickel transport system ATP-binding protein
MASTSAEVTSAEQLVTGEQAALVPVRNLSVAFIGGGRTVHAVNDVDFDLALGEVLGVIGESGSGKSVTLRAPLRILPPKRTRIGGTLCVAGKDVLAFEGRDLEDYRGVASMIV